MTQIIDLAQSEQQLFIASFLNNGNRPNQPWARFRRNGHDYRVMSNCLENMRPGNAYLFKTAQRVVTDAKVAPGRDAYDIILLELVRPVSLRDMSPVVSGINLTDIPATKQILSLEMGFGRTKPTANTRGSRQQSTGIVATVRSLAVSVQRIPTEVRFLRDVFAMEVVEHNGKLIGVSQRDKEQIVRDTTSMLNAFEIAYGFDPKYSDMTFFISGNEVSAEEMVDYISNQVDVSGVKAAMDAKRKQAEEDAAYAAAKGEVQPKKVTKPKKVATVTDEPVAEVVAEPVAPAVELVEQVTVETVAEVEQEVEKA